MEFKDFPGLYQASDEASLSAQKNYKNIIAYDLITMIIASALAIYNYEKVEPKLIVYVISGIFLLISFALTLIIRTKKFEDVWYQGRALAESCKTLSWRFVTCSESFENDLTKQEVEDYFISRVRELSKEFKELNDSLNAKIVVLPVITDKMWEIRNLNTLERKQYYIENRINDQKDWYASKAEFNKKKYNNWFLVIIVSQLIAIISVAFLVKYPESNWNLVGLFTTISASAISWLQLKQHQELKQAYTTAAQELNFIQASFGNINSDIELAEFVLDSENAISREHTLWLAQRRK
ncbi:MAG: DUF4231 domain-containing protein [Ignavibacteriae bacterium]|nr:DUF4231 domain-containing protein [Ignavibacteriota bacterium]